jgi:outer membrane scaffolding protein for murein synthesis (MipA/OmpV family)
MLQHLRCVEGSGVRVEQAVLMGIIAALPMPAAAELRPQWELGAGAVGMRLPDYRGSDESRSYVYPLPYLIYRGEVLRVDREGARAKFFQYGRAELDFSLHATPPVHSEDNRARQGMPDLDPTIELGPLISVSLVRDRVRERRLDLRVPLRAVIATDLSHVHGAGFVLYPHLSSSWRLGGWHAGLQAGPLYATQRYHRYFYGVDPQFATPARPAYAASAGYSGALALASLSRRFGRLWVGGFLRYDALDGAVFADSPLVKRDHGVMAGLAFAWVFAESARKVDVIE